MLHIFSILTSAGSKALLKRAEVMLLQVFAMARSATQLVIHLRASPIFIAPSLPHKSSSFCDHDHGFIITLPPICFCDTPTSLPTTSLRPHHRGPNISSCYSIAPPSSGEAHHFRSIPRRSLWRHRLTGLIRTSISITFQPR